MRVLVMRVTAFLAEIVVGSAGSHRIRRHQTRRAGIVPAVPQNALPPDPFAGDPDDPSSALEALDDLASAVLSGGCDSSAPGVLCELGQLLGLDLTRPVDTGS